MTLVYEGLVYWYDQRLNDNSEVTLTTPFHYNNTDNLIIHIENHFGEKEANSDNQFLTFSESLSNYPCKYNQQDGMFPVSAGTRTHELPRVYLTFDPGLDAGISEISDEMHSAGLQDISVKFTNYLTDEITSVDIDWEIDGTPQTTYNWTGTLLSGVESDILVLGSHSFSSGEHTLKAWTVDPNEGTDEDADNDTMEVTILVVDPVFVDADASGAKNGTSWTDAYDSLQTALKEVSANTIIWVAEGTYLPTNTGDMAKSFEIPDSVWIYGGFDGTETDLLQRNLIDNTVILSGDIGISDDADDNSMHVLIAGNNVRIDGFTIVEGNADSTCADCGRGGGLMLNGVKDVKVSHCIFKSNNALEGGGIGAYFALSPVYIDSCTFLENSASNGGALGFQNTPSEISHSVFAGNHAGYGGVIYNYRSGSITSIDRCTFYDNSYLVHGSILRNAWSGLTSTIENSIFYGNQTPLMSLVNGAILDDIEVSYSLIDPSEIITGNNNVTGDPLFADTINYNLQIMGGSPCIDTGDPESPLDPDGTRADMGALYFDLEIDAGVIQYFDPASEVQAGILPVKVAIKNFGRNTLNTVTIGYEIDGVFISNINWTGSLLYSDTSSQVSLGSHDFTYGDHTIKVWTSNPNSATDELALNDTLVLQVRACEYLDGTYTIGSSGDFSTINEAVDSLSNMCGINGDVIFNIQPGTYNDQVMISDITGLSETATITFQSSSGDSTDVVLTTDSTDYLIYLDGTDYITFKNISFESDSAVNLVVLDSGACNNVFEGNLFSPANGSTSIWSGVFNDSNNVFRGNRFIDGSYGINLKATHPEVETSVHIIDNVFGVQGHSAIYLSRCDSALISGNQITSVQYGIYLNICNSHITEANSITMQGSSSKDGIRITNCMSDTTQSSLIRNNFVTGYSSYGAGINLQYSTHQKVYHNSVNVTNSTAIELYNSDNVTSKNNILISDVAVINWYYNVDNFVSDYNTYFSGPDKFEYNNRAGTFEEWQDTSKQDANSLYFMPVFEGEGDLHTASYLLDSAGTALIEVSKDIDGESRNATHPDIGADEYISPCSGFLSGSYSIGASGDYTSFGDAMYALLNCGIDGDVVFTVESGTYNEQVLIGGMIPGSSIEDSIIFRSSGDPESVILTWDADTLSNYTVKLDGAERITLKDISIESENAIYGRVVELSGGAHHNLINGCIISGPVADGDDDFQALIYMPGDLANPDTNNTFQGNQLSNGSHGIYLKSSNTTDIGKNNSIKGNEFTGQSAYGIRSDYQYNLLIKGNYIENTNLLGSQFYGIYLAYHTDSAIVSANRVNIDREAISHGIWINAQNVWTINNAISLRSGDYHSAGIYGLGHDSKCYFNSVNAYGSNQHSALDISYNTSNVVIKNNIFTNQAFGKAIKCMFGTTMVSDFNSLYTNGEFIGVWNNQQNVSDLAGWVIATGGDANSVNPAPGHFVSDTDLHTSFILFDSAGVALAEVTEDIEGDTRNITHPDIGADEFSNPVFSLGEDLRFCVDEDFTLHAGTGFDSYLWSTGAETESITLDSTGRAYTSMEYSVIVELGGTEYKDTINITFSSPVAAPNNYCYCAYETFPDSVLITAGEGLYYRWGSGPTDTIQSIWVIPTSWAQYYVTVTDEYGCSAYDYIDVQSLSCAAGFLWSADTSMCSRDNIVIDANQWSCPPGADYEYLWSTGDTTETLTLDGSVLGVGTHTIHVSVISHLDNCTTSDTVNVIVQDCTGFSDEMYDRKMYVFPNPSTGYFELRTGRTVENALITIFDAGGRMVYSQKERMLTDGKSFDLSNLSMGIYTIKVQSQEVTWQSKIVLQ
jgi:hypothetical protein